MAATQVRRNRRIASLILNEVLPRWRRTRRWATPPERLGQLAILIELGLMTVNEARQEIRRAP